MPDSPLLTVAVAMFNSEDTVQAALESIYSQGTPGVEVVIVNDASTDRSVSVAQDIDSRGMSVRVVHHKTNQGLGPARNSGIKQPKANTSSFWTLTTNYFRALSRQSRQWPKTRTRIFCLRAA